VSGAPPQHPEFARVALADGDAADRRDRLANLALQLAAVRDPREVHDFPLTAVGPLSGYWMPEPPEARSIIENAEQAATAGNYCSAEKLLREAAALQEQTLGPHHPDLANTLNNLGVVCEKADNPIDAEHYFRRAYRIATATLASDHPFVVTSRKNLHDFCAARGRPAELRPSPPAVAAWLEAPAQRAAPPRESSPSAEKQDVTPIPRKRSLRPFALGALGAGALLIVLLMMTRSWDSRAEEAKSPAATAIHSAPETAAPSPTPPPTNPTGRQPPAKPQPARSEADAVTARPNTLTRSAAMPTVVTAQLCTALRAWRCKAADGQVPAGPMFFYTQVKSATATTIEHRWYRGDRLRYSVQLRIQANPGAGYRTYSRNTVSGGGGGDWRVELRSADGAVLHEERFAVR
jgi:tetratricopeptide (TPR) repeat protein